MRRLAMAATFALALSIGGLSPAVALADDNSAADATVVPATGNGDAETPGPEDPPAGPGDDADPGADGTPAEPGDGEDSTDPGGDENAADPGDGEEAADPGEGSGEPTEDSTPIDASFSLDRSTMPVDEAAEAIPYTITGLKAGDTVTAEPGENGSTTVDSDGTYNGELRGNTELKVGDVVGVTVVVARDGQESKTFTGSVEITDSHDDSDATVSVDPQSQTIDSYLDNGVDITVSSCEPGEEVTVTIVRKGEDTNIWEETKTAGDDGSVSTSFMPGTGGDGWIGDFVVSAECGDMTAETTYSVTENDDGTDADLSVTPQSQKLADFLENGVNITLVNCHVDSEVTFQVSSATDPDTVIWEETQDAGEDTAGSVRFVPDGDGGTGWIGDFTVAATCGDKSAETTFTVTDDGSVIDPTLSISPERISGVDFIDRDKGVQMTLTDCAADADAHFEVYSGDKSEKLYEQTATADQDGTAGIQVYGLGDDPAYYVGTYHVVAACMDVSRSGKFVVTGGESGGGNGGESGEAGGSAGGSSMPRTGAELTGLTAGALLILGGGAAIGLARRKNWS